MHPSRRPAPPSGRSRRTPGKSRTAPESQGYLIRNGRLLVPVLTSKDHIRALHAEAVSENCRKAEPALKHHEDSFVARLGIGGAIDLGRVRPILIPITDKRSGDAALWRWCSLHWSIPISTGYGRRLRFLVVDQAHSSNVIGLIGLSDPVFALKARDSWIGWTADERAERLVSVMDAFVLGAVPPYRGILGGKLLALLVSSNEVRAAFKERYEGRTTLITGRATDARLAAVTTTSALGRSSVYNRLARPDGTPSMIPVGYTSGTGDFHFSGPIYDDLVSFASSTLGPKHTQRNGKWPGGQGSFRNRREVIQKALYSLGFDGYAMRSHGVRRQVFISPLMANAAMFLRGHEHTPRWSTLSTDELSSFWLKRWARPRAKRAQANESAQSEFTSFQPDTWRLWTV